MARPRKPEAEKAKPRNLTFPDAIWELADRLARDQHFSGVSPYLTHLIKEDARNTASSSLDLPGARKRAIRAGAKRIKPDPQQPSS
jgi:hypothetical protein